MRTFEYILMLDPLEQFDLTKLGNINILQSGLFFSCAYTYALVAKAKKSDFYDLKHKNLSMRCILDFIFNAIKGSLHIKRHNMLVGVGLTFIYILMCNCIGLVPYTFTNTSSLVVTFYLAIMLFGGINIISIFINSWHYFKLFLPTGVPPIIIPFLIPIEIVSYFSRVISLAVRLFANMMSGHTLLKILVGFLWVLYISFLKGLLPIIFLIVIPIPFIAMIIIFILECAVAFLQAYVFLTLVTIYLNDGINLH